MLELFIMIIPKYSSIIFSRESLNQSSVAPNNRDAFSTLSRQNVIQQTLSERGCEGALTEDICK